MSEAGDKIIAGLNEALAEADRALCEMAEQKANLFHASAAWGFDETGAVLGKLVERIRELSRQLAAAEADAARLAEAGESCAEDLEAEVRDRWGYDERLERQLRRDMRPVVEFREALAAHTARLIDG